MQTQLNLLSYIGPGLICQLVLVGLASRLVTTRPVSLCGFSLCTYVSICLSFLTTYTPIGIAHKWTESFPSTVSVPLI